MSETCSYLYQTRFARLSISLRPQSIDLGQSKGTRAQLPEKYAVQVAIVRNLYIDLKTEAAQANAERTGVIALGLFLTNICKVRTC